MSVFVKIKSQYCQSRYRGCYLTQHFIELVIRLFGSLKYISRTMVVLYSMFTRWRFHICDSILLPFFIALKYNAIALENSKIGD